MKFKKCEAFKEMEDCLRKIRMAKDDARENIILPCTIHSLFLSTQVKALNNITKHECNCNGARLLSHVV